MSNGRGILEELRRAVGRDAEGNPTEEGDGETMGAIARRAGLTHGEIGRYIRGERVPSLDHAERIAKALGGKLVLRRQRKRTVSQ